MPVQVLMPALSPTMTEGKLAKWAKKEGDKVSSGDVIAEIETDKATMEVELADEGILGRILVPEGTEAVAVNTPIALLLGDGEDASALEAASASPQMADKEPAMSPRGEFGDHRRAQGSDRARAAARGGIHRPDGEDDGARGAAGRDGRGDAA